MPPGISANHRGLLGFCQGHSCTRPTFIWGALSWASGACTDHPQANTRDIACDRGRPLHRAGKGPANEAVPSAAVWASDRRATISR
jgi:hypothetical protein